MNTERGETPRHPIRVVSKRTGLTPALLRAWEKRYGVVEPARSEGGQRLYSDDDVQRLSLLHRVVEEGRNISQVASLSTTDLQELVEEDQKGRVGSPAPQPLESVSVLGILEGARRAVTEMDPVRLERTLTRGAMAISVPALIDDVLIPLLDGIGISWMKGQLGPAHEHLASVVIRRFLEWLLNTVDVGLGAPVLVAATPARERHELGALLSAVYAASEGWKAIYLGPDLPAEEIASAAARLGARVVTLSVVDPALSESFLPEIVTLREAMSPSVRLVVGGPGPILSSLRPRVPNTEFLGALAELRESLRREGERF
ncbi:MAG: MerR family transcriptional regulator [Longimicrobiales bacterium]